MTSSGIVVVLSLGGVNDSSKWVLLHYRVLYRNGCDYPIVSSVRVNVFIYDKWYHNQKDMDYGL